MNTSLKQALRSIGSVVDIPNPTLGLDIDGTIDENPIFFQVLTAVWPGKVIIVTWRSDRKKTIANLEQFGIRYDDLILVSGFAEKSEIIKKYGVSVFVEDQDEVIQHIPDSVTVLKIRNGGNYEDGKWLYSKSTGRLV